MKFERNPKYTTIAIYALIVLIIAMLCYHALQSIGILFDYAHRLVGFVLPAVYGVVFAFLLNPLLRTIENRLLPRVFGKAKPKPSAKRGIAILITYLIALVALVAFFRLVLPQLIEGLVSLFGNVNYYFKYLTNLYDNIIVFMEEFLHANNSTNTTQIANELSDMIISSIRASLNALITLLEHSLSALATLAASISNIVINLVLGVIISIYILLDREKLFAQLKKIGRAVFPNDTYNLIYDIAMDINRIFSGFVIGKVIDSLIIGILCVIGMSILQLDYAVLISVIVGVTNVIPYFGPFIGAVPGAIILFIISPMKALWFLIFILLLQQLDGNVIGPKILGETIGLSPLWIVFSIMLFSGLLGVLGMFIGVPLFAILYSLVKRFIAYLLRRKGESDNTRDYDSESNPLIK